VRVNMLVNFSRIAGLFCCALAIGEEPAQLLLTANGKPVLAYNAGYVPSPNPAAPFYGRSGFLHPVYSPAGRIVTDGFPADHMHQHGLMFAWTKTVFDDHAVDFWNQAAQLGHVEHVETVHADADRIVAKLQHVDDTTSPSVVVLHETWEITRVPLEAIDPSWALVANVFDLVSTQTCATERPLLIPEFHYGGMCVRGPESWAGSAGTMLTSEGQGRVDGNHTRPVWTALFGQREEATCGIAAMSHPSNFRSPQPVRLHPELAYFCFAPMVLGEFKIEPGKPYVSRFRFVAFDGPADAEKLARIWDHFSK
jgi:Methane oxygenase PmoA